MADYGASSPIFAAFDGPETKDAPPTYKPGIIIGHLVSCGVTPNYAEGSLSGDNATVNHQRVLKDIDLAVETDDIKIENALQLFGGTMIGADLHYLRGSGSAMGGYGFYHTTERDSVNYHIGHFYPKTRVSRSAHTFNTVGDNITYGTSSLAAKAMYPSYKALGAEVESEPFTDEEAAFAWVANKLNLGDYFVVNINVQGATAAKYVEIEGKDIEYGSKAFVLKNGSLVIDIVGHADVKAAWDNGVDKTAAITGGTGQYTLSNVQANHDITIVF